MKAETATWHKAYPQFNTKAECAEWHARQRVSRRRTRDYAAMCRKRYRGGIGGAASIDINSSGTIRIWIPPTGRPYWVIAGKPNAGPDLTDEEIEQGVKCRSFDLQRTN